MAGEPSVTELAEPFTISLPAVSKHLKVLEQAGLIARGREAQCRARRLAARPRRGGAPSGGGGPPQGGGRLGGGIPPVLGAEPGTLRPPRRLPARGAGEGAARRPEGPVTIGTRSDRTIQERSSPMADLQGVPDPGTQQIVVTRSFAAPRELVFKAFTDPDAVRRWWGSRDNETIVDELEARPGGRWRFVQRSGGGKRNGFHGVFHEATAPERIVYTFEWEGLPGHVLLETVTLEEQDGKT